MSIQSALAILQEDRLFDSKKVKQVHSALQEGLGVSQAFSFLVPQALKYMVSKGEVPLLREYLIEMENGCENKLKAAQALQKELLYPFVLVLGLIGVLTLFFAVLVPTYSQFYQSMNLQVPLFLSVALNVRQWSLPLMGISVLCLVFLAQKQQWFSRGVGLLFPLDSSDLFWKLGLMLKSGVSLKQSLDAINWPKTHPMFERVQAFVDDAHLLGSLAEAAFAHLPVSEFYIQWLNYAEKSGQLASILLDMSNQLQEESQQNLVQRLKWVQPILLLAISGLIALAFYAMMVPMIQSFSALI